MMFRSRQTLNNTKKLYDVKGADSRLGFQGMFLSALGICFHTILLIINLIPSLCYHSVWNVPVGAWDKTRSLKNEMTQSAATCSSWFLTRGFFYFDDGGDTFLRNVGSHKIYTAPHSRGRHSKYSNARKLILISTLMNTEIHNPISNKRISRPMKYIA
jgi:hypothetical protein